MTTPSADTPSATAGDADGPVAEQVRAIVARVCRIDPARVQDTDRFREELGVDSLAKLELVVQVERAFDVRFEDDEAAALASVGDVIQRLLASRAS
jgi:acyl carrier protein